MLLSMKKIVLFSEIGIETNGFIEINNVKHSILTRGSDMCKNRAEKETLEFGISYKVRVHRNEPKYMEYNELYLQSRISANQRN